MMLVDDHGSLLTMVVADYIVIVGDEQSHAGSHRWLPPNDCGSYRGIPIAVSFSFCFNIFQIHDTVVNFLVLMVQPPFFINQKLNSGVNSLLLMVKPPFFIDQTCSNRDLHVHNPMTCNPAGGSRGWWRPGRHAVGQGLLSRQYERSTGNWEHLEITCSHLIVSVKQCHQPPMTHHE